MGSIHVTAGLSRPRDHALVSLLALNGLRVSEAIGANIESLGLERGHRTFTVLRKGGKLVTPERDRHHTQQGGTDVLDKAQHRRSIQVQHDYSPRGLRVDATGHYVATATGGGDDYSSDRFGCRS